ncbi:Ig-like domain-containing protein [Bacillus sp. EB01]|uniref:Ig-like domain-containing protein n=1 Tax=Bacillus sp. EB01 TaxID=1347086 RepID=UPI0006943F2F|nr:Ig-like domain-containing protein [Bacillus sp. EB01]
MRKKRRLVAFLLVLQLLVLPLTTAAEEGDAKPAENQQTSQTVSEENISPSTGNKLNSSLNTVSGQNPRKMQEQLDFTDPTSYPLISKGGRIGDLTDTYGGSQYFFFKNLAEYSSDQMELTIEYYSDYTYSKDPYFWIEFYTESQGNLTFVGSVDYDTTGSDALYLYAQLPKSVFLNQPYLYMRAGVTDTYDADYWVDVVNFKVANPFYTGGGGDETGGDSFALISNESLNAEVTQPTGTFSINNNNYSFSKELKQGAYKLDYIKPFDPESSKGGLVKKNSQSILPSYVKGDSKYFWTANLETGQYNSTRATLAYSGTKANIWVNAYDISDSQAEQLGREFESRIYPSVTSNFGKESDVNGDGKIDILAYDIQDGFSGSGGFVAGYFYSGDLYNDAYSNKSEIFYVDTYPLMGSYSDDVTAAYETLAHEFQHMVNFNQNVLVEGGSDMPVWLDEAFAMAAEEIYLGRGLTDRLDYYNASQSTANGHSLLYWDYEGDTLANYSLSYLFGQYLKIQTNRGNAIFKEILTDSNNDYKAVENAVKKYINPSLTIGKVMTNFRAALLLKEPFGYYGFKGNSFFNSLNVRAYNGNSANLRGGGAITVRYDSSEGFIEPVSKGANITYTYFKEGESSDTVAPAKPFVYPVGDSDTKLTGVAEPNSAVFAKVGGTEIGRSYAGNDGQFTIAIAKQRPGTTVYVYAEDAAGNISQSTAVTVQDKTAPSVPIVNEVSDKDEEVTGTGEAGSIIIVKAGGIEIGRATATVYGTFTVRIPVQKAGTVLAVTASDRINNVSAPVYITVKAQPFDPMVNGVANGGFYNHDVVITFLGTATLNGSEFTSGRAVTDEGTYNLVVTGENGTADLSFTIDKSIPEVFGVTTGTAYNTDVTLYYADPNLGSATLNGKPIANASTIKTQGSYEFIVRDKAGNKRTVVFKIDKIKPVVTGVSVNGLYNKDVTVSFNEGTATLDGIAFNKGSVISKEGLHKLIVKDAAGNVTEVSFIIDKTGPGVTGVAKNKYYNKDVRAYFTDGNKVKSATLNGAAYVSGTLISAAKVYTLVVTDMAGNATTVKFTIDKTAPKVTGVANGKYYNKDVRVYFNEGKATLNGAAFKSGTLVTTAKAYTLVVTDSAGNKTTVKFTIDKTKPGAPKVNTVKSTHRTVVGTAEAYTVITVKAGTKVIGTATTDKYGKFKVSIPAQKRNITLYVTAKDRAGNLSTAAKKVVQ